MTYTLIYKCSNCDTVYQISFQWGREALTQLNCPVCGNETTVNKSKNQKEEPNYQAHIESKRLVMY